MLKVRAAAAADLAVLKNLVQCRHAELPDHDYLEDAVLEALLRHTLPGSVLLAFSDEEPVGYCSFSLYGSVRHGRTELYLDDLYVLPAWRRQYFAKLMLNTAVRMVSDLLCTAVRWSCTDEGAAAFFAHCGAPEPVHGQYFVDVLGIPKLAAFTPCCGGHHTPT